MMAERIVTYTLEIHDEGEGGIWAEVKELPGCFASGFNMDELYESVEESIGLYLSSDDERVTVRRAGEGVEERRNFELCSA